MSSRTWRSMHHDELNRAWDQIKSNLRKGGVPEVYLQFELLKQFSQLMESGGLWPEHMNWNMMPGLYKQTPGLPTLTVKPLVWEKWCKEPYTQWEPTQLAGDFWPGMALIICYSQHHDLPKNKDNLQGQMVNSMTLTYIPEHWQLASFQESSYVINAARAAGDPQGMISLTRVHKKAPFLPDVSYQEYGQHMSITPLTLPDPSAPPDDDGLLMCGPPYNFAIGAFHCKPQSSGKSGKMAFYVPPVFQKAPQGELLVLNGCNGKTWEWHRLRYGPT